MATAASQPPEAESGVEVVTAAVPAGKPRRFLGRLGAVVLTLVVVAVVALAVALTVLPALVGGQTLTVLSGSMQPRLPVGSVVVNKPADVATLQRGDIVTYAIGDTLITHRIVAIKQSSDGPVFTTRGDANNADDTAPVHAAQLRGRLWYDVPYIGTVRNFVLSKAGIMVGGGAVVLCAGIWFLVRLNRPRELNQSRQDGS
ncbi:signal peptidase I [Microlunatus elymi]|uniref:Signal peptidase I n=1 Tax=Microlunatus elymi TaxID=2596828 RepID=A0A516Q3E3_9ACTN|nr:signal peptidase I [Microlunatus elymi]QDP97954.1 signal peptidase I [Microlunatus elymi]